MYGVHTIEAVDRSRSRSMIRRVVTVADRGIAVGHATALIAWPIERGQPLQEEPATQFHRKAPSADDGKGRSVARDAHQPSRHRNLRPRPRDQALTITSGWSPAAGVIVEEAPGSDAPVGASAG